jgi:hypothetical protein
MCAFAMICNRFVASLLRTENSLKDVDSMGKSGSWLGFKQWTFLKSVWFVVLTAVAVCGSHYLAAIAELEREHAASLQAIFPSTFYTRPICAL